MAPDRQPTPAGLDPNSLTLADASRLLTRVGAQPVTVAMLQADRDDGAPANVDGTLNLVHYAAWLLGEMGRGE
jgi:hypothetical protein